jgi:hypothetical protein
MDIFLLGPFVKLGPLRNSEVANFVGFVSTISLIIILTTALLAYGYVTFSDSKENKTTVDFLNSKGWSHFRFYCWWIWWCKYCLCTIKISWYKSFNF